MQIGTVAKKIGLSVDAIRFYERSALLPRAPRTPGGFRHYAQNDVETLAFIRRVQGLGFKLSEIRSLLRLRGVACSHARRCAIGWSKSWPTFDASWPIFKSWSTSCVWLCEVATRSCAGKEHIAQF